MRGGVSGGMVSGLVRGLVGGFVFSLVSGLVVVSLGVTVIGNISNVTRVAIDFVVDVLLAAVGKNNPVVSGGVVTIATLVLAHVHVVVVIVDSPVEFVVSGGLKNEERK